jgi:hypothetical protein
MVKEAERKLFDPGVVWTLSLQGNYCKSSVTEKILLGETSSASTLHKRIVKSLSTL